MELIICIDDTDNLESPGTGHLAEILRKEIEGFTGGTTTRITRHQLFVSPDIPYTSHNSAMCFTADVDEKFYGDIVEYTKKFLEKNSAPGSDPGFCAAVKERLSDMSPLISFGLSATKTVLTKNDASALAAQMKIHLSEHGGTGGGIIGAVAGVGLRLYGNNGRFKGWIPVEDHERDTTVSEVMDKFDIDEVRTTDGMKISGKEQLILADKVKTVLLDGLSVLPVKRSADNMKWINLSKDEIRKY
jgi:hypothetical protein